VGAGKFSAIGDCSPIIGMYDEIER